jgi:dihydrofolate reductase
MRRLKLQMQVSVDGFVATGPNDEQKWVTWAWDEIKSDVLELFDTSDTILIGRKLAVDYIPYWKSVTNTDDPMFGVAQRINNAKKIVFTKTLEKSDPMATGWANTTLAKGNLADEIKQLKEQSGKDIIVYGGTSFVSSLIKEELIDEFNFFINPVALGKGDPIFNKLENHQNLRLKTLKKFDCGIVLLCYELQKK